MKLTKSEIFVQAHILAKAKLEIFQCYRRAFSFALICIYGDMRADKMLEDAIKEERAALSIIELEQKQDAARAEEKRADDARIETARKIAYWTEHNAKLEKENAAVAAEIKEVEAQIKKNDKALAILVEIDENKTTYSPVKVLVHWSESNAFGGVDDTMMKFKNFEKIAAQVAQDNGDVNENGYSKTKVTVYFDDAEESSYACRLDLALGDEVGFQDHMNQMINSQDRACMAMYADNIAFAKQIDYSKAA